jgi:hypothetical protein
MARVVFSGLADLDIDVILIDLATKARHFVAAKYDGLFNRLYDRFAFGYDFTRVSLFV